jgi:hypothetical protein
MAAVLWPTRASDSDCAFRRARANAVRLPSGAAPQNCLLICGLVAQRKAVGHLLRIRLIQRLAKFAAINFRFLTDLILDVRREIIPTLQMSGTELPFCVFLITGTLFGFAHLDLHLWRGHYGGSRRYRRRRGWWSSRYRALWCRVLSHSSIPLSHADLKFIFYSNPGQPTNCDFMDEKWRPMISSWSAKCRRPKDSPQERIRPPTNTNRVGAS